MNSHHGTWRKLKIRAKENGATVNRTMTKSPHGSNCCVASDYLDLGKILEEGDFQGVPGRRKAAARAMVQGKKTHGGGGSSNGSDLDSATGEESEGDSDLVRVKT